MDLLSQLNAAMRYIEEHIAGDMALGDVASATAYSPYHFGRLFYYIAELPLSEYIRRRKLSLAAMELQTGGARVLDLAVKYGYDSADSFMRAFVKQHNVTPSAARQPGVHLTIFPPLTFQIKIEGVQAMNWRIEEREAFEVFGIERIFGNDEVGMVPGFWTELRESGAYERLYQAAGAKCGEDGMHCISAVCGYNEAEDDRFPYMICTLKKPGSQTDGYKIAQVLKSAWAVFRSEMIPEMGTAIPALFDRAYKEWLPSSEYEKVSAPDLEIYYTAPGGMYFEEAWIPVRKRTQSQDF